MAKEEIKEEEVVVEEPKEEKKGVFGKVKDAILQMPTNRQQSSPLLLELPFLPGRVEY